MFRCNACKKVTNPREKMVRVVSERRKKFYEKERSEGWEIVREVSVCTDCAKLPTVN